MKTNLLLLLIALTTCFSQSQTYKFTLIQNTGSNYTVAAIPDFDSGTGVEPNAIQYNFVIMLQDGASVDQSTINFHHLAFDSATVTGAAALDGADPGYDRSATAIVSNNGSSLIAEHLIGDVVNLVTFDVLNIPTIGEISILDNNSGLAIAAGGAFDSFLGADITGGNTAANVYDGQTGTTSYSFATLSTQKSELTGVSLYPNPTNGNVSIKGVNDLQRVEVMNVNGQRVMSFNSNLETINVSSLNSGVYFVKLETAVATKTIKLIKK